MVAKGGSHDDIFPCEKGETMGKHEGFFRREGDVGDPPPKKGNTQGKTKKTNEHIDK